LLDFNPEGHSRQAMPFGVTDKCIFAECMRNCLPYNNATPRVLTGQAYSLNICVIQITLADRFKILHIQNPKGVALL